jgi:hypothetical protein
MLDVFQSYDNIQSKQEEHFDESFNESVYTSKQNVCALECAFSNLINAWYIGLCEFLEIEAETEYSDTHPIKFWNQLQYENWRLTQKCFEMLEYYTENEAIKSNELSFLFNHFCFLHQHLGKIQLISKEVGFELPSPTLVQIH